MPATGSTSGTTGTPGSDARTATTPDERRAMSWVKRFSRTERTLHWVNAAGFLLLLATGLILYLPSLSADVGRRPLMKNVHFWGGIGWVASLALVVLLGDRRGILRTARELDLFAQEDVNWLRRRRPWRQ